MTVPNRGHAVSYRFFAGLVFVTLALLSVRRASAQERQSPHIIQGQVTTDSGAVIAGADVIVTVAPTAEVLTGKSDGSGVFRLVIANPTGEYLVNVAALGRKTFRQRVAITAPRPCKSRRRIRDRDNRSERTRAPGPRARTSRTTVSGIRARSVAAAMHPASTKVPFITEQQAIREGVA